jgi:FkbM family methyltransferase
MREASAAGPFLRLIRWAAARLPRGRARLARALARVLRTPFVDTVEPRDLQTRMVIDPSDPFQLEIWLGTYQPHVISFLRQSIKPGATVLVAGLHVGYIATLAARLAGPRGIVLSAEPDPAARDAAQRNLAMLDGTCAPVHVLAAGLSDSDGSLTIHLSSTLGHSSFAGPHHARARDVVPLRRGDDWLRERGVRALDVLVLDVEGWECHALGGLAGVIAESPHLVALVEVSDWALRDAGASVSMLLDWLDAHGFDVFWAESPTGRHGVSGARADANDVRAGDVLCVKKAAAD